MKINKIYKTSLMAAAFSLSLLTVSCSDEWDDHYSTSAVSDGTLWSAIKTRSDISNFARVVEACGYDLNLNGNQSYTVFAPTNSVLTNEMADSLIQAYKTQATAGVSSDDNSVIRQFLQNHIALYKHSVSASTDQSITLMNGKYEPFTATSIGNAPIVSSNQLCSNGLLYTLSGKINYFPNVFEYLGLTDGLDSVYNFLKKYNVYEFNESKSVEGGIVNGQTVYLDSVTELTNRMFDILGYINNEDSTYWMVAPDNNAWNTLYNEYLNYYVYDVTQNKYDSLQRVNASLAILKGLFFSKTVNPNIEKESVDSLTSTSAPSGLYRKLYDEDYKYYITYNPYAAGGLFDGTTDKECSNGHVRTASTLNMDKRNTFLQTIKIEAENANRLDSVANCNTTFRQVSTSNPFYNKISGNMFIECTPLKEGSNPFLYYNVPNVLSNVGYDVYVVFAPALAYDTAATDAQRMPNRFTFQISYNDVKGVNQINKRPGSKSRYDTQVDVVDTILVAENFKFPTSTYGLTQSTAKLNLIGFVTAGTSSMFKYDMLIDCFILKPHEE